MHGDARARARLSLDGLSVGDAFGETFFGETHEAVRRIEARSLRPAPWRWTDDTEMAVSVVQHLEEHGDVHDQDRLARRFAERMQDDRGYGRGAYEILDGIREGRSWRALSRNGFRGMGSFGNGAAMRVAPLGAFFADRALETIREQAALSAEITHAHPEGIAGAIAIAVATALAWRSREGPLGSEWLESVRDATPQGYTRDGLEEALALPDDATVIDAARALGNGSGVTAPDTVPLCLWIVSRHADDYERALWETVRALGDRDTTCAIVGGIVSLRVGRDAIPRAWLASREPLPG